MKFRLLVLTVAAAVVATASVAQEKDAKSNDQKHEIRMETDSGRYGVGSDKLDPKQLGVSIYPGARVEKKTNDDKGANLSLDWGKDSTHLYAQTYVTPDSPEKVLAFYRKQLAKYGKVLECRGGQSQVSVNSELKCDDKHDSNDKSVELKAGTADNQHIVGVTPKENGTEIGIVYLQKSGTM
jgi:hypothetical protein